MSQQLPIVIITGASGFIGHYFINYAKEKYRIYAFARRNQKDSGVAEHPNITWLRVDIGEEKEVSLAIENISKKHNSVDFVLHFAGYYDFTDKNVLEYERTNVLGTANLLKNIESLNPKRFIFSSSLAVTDHTVSHRIIDETSPADAAYPYAISKGKAEELVRQHSEKFPCIILRLAAIYSDWCEYGPLYALINSWLNKGWQSRVIVGRGESALPYLHVADFITCISKIFSNNKNLSQLEILLASPNGCLSHNQIFSAAQKYYHGTTISPQRIPITLASLGVIGMNIIGKIVGSEPFEKLWMLKYIDHRMDIDASHTHEVLDWQPKPRYDLLRRMLFMIENMKSNSPLWAQKNIAMAHKKEEERPGLKIYNAMISVKNIIIQEHVKYLSSPKNSAIFPNYQKNSEEELIERVTYIYEMLETSVLSGHRTQLLGYSRNLAKKLLKEQYDLKEVMRAFNRLANKLAKSLRKLPELTRYQHKIRDQIVVTMQMIVDEVEDVYETFLEQK